MKSNENNNNLGNPDINNNEDIKCQENSIDFINYRFIGHIINKKIIDLKEVIQIEVLGDGNCLMRCIALFKFKDELKHNKVRKDIVNYLKLHINEFQKIEIDTEIGPLDIINYINYISKFPVHKNLKNK